MPRSLPLLLALLLVSSSAGAAIRVTPELPVADPVLGAAEGASLPVIVTDGTDFLVLWRGRGGINAKHITAGGKVVGLPRVAIPTSDDVSEISACWTGSVVLVSWREHSVVNEVTVNVATVGRDGALVSPPRVVIRGAVTISGALASNGRRALLAYASAVEPYVARAALFDGDGTLLASDLPLPVGSAMVSNRVDIAPHVASDGNEFAIVWRTGDLLPLAPSLNQLLHTFHLARLSDDGSVIGTTIDFPRAEQTGEYGVTFGGGRYAIAAIEQHLIKIGQGQARVLRYIVDPAARTVTALPTVDTIGYEASVVWNGSQFIASWIKYFSTSAGLRTELSTVPFDEAASPATARNGAIAALGARFAWNGKDVVGVWSEAKAPYLGGGMSLVAGRFDPAVTAMLESAPFLVSIDWSRQFRPAIATSGLESMVVWIEDRGEPYKPRLLGRRMAMNGTPIDTTPFEISSSVSRFDLPVITFTGLTYLVAWSETGLMARSVGRDGALGALLPIAEGSTPAIASNPSTTLLVFQGRDGLAGARFNARGELLDTTPLHIGKGWGPKVATNGTDFFVAWNVGSDWWQFPPPDLIDVLGKRVAASGAVDASPLAIAMGGDNQTLGALGSDGRDYIVFFSLWKFTGKQSLSAKRILAEGQLEGGTAGDDGTVVASDSAAFSGSPVAVAGDAGGFWVAWFLSTYPGALRLVHTDLRGNAGEPVTLAAIDSLNSIDSGLSLAQAPGGPLQMVYARRVPDGPYAGTSRAFVRFAAEALGGRPRAARH